MTEPSVSPDSYGGCISIALQIFIALGRNIVAKTDISHALRDALNDNRIANLNVLLEAISTKHVARAITVRICLEEMLECAEVEAYIYTELEVCQVCGYERQHRYIDRPDTDETHKDVRCLICRTPGEIITTTSVQREGVVILDKNENIADNINITSLTLIASVYEVYDRWFAIINLDGEPWLLNNYYTVKYTGRTLLPINLRFTVYDNIETYDD